MKDYALVTDATVDLPQSVLDEIGVKVIAMPIRLSDREVMYEPSQRQLSVKEFYQRLREGEKPETAQINMTLFLDTFIPLAKQGLDILYLSFSSGLSGTYQSARMAGEELRQLYPDVRIWSVDTLSASVGEAAFIYEAARLKREGMSFEDLCAWAHDNRQRVNHWFTVEDLFHLYRGGRLSKSSAIMGTALNIKPVLTMDEDGKLKVADKIRGKQRAFKRLVEMVDVTLAEDTRTLMVGHGDDLETAQRLADMIKASHPELEIILCDIGPVIGAHVGAGMVAAAYVGKPRNLRK
ncbi:MAG: DegV family protein [Clostridia bacterium]|nr:DegV family protein [Clostridia bacterium]